MIFNFDHVKTTFLQGWIRARFCRVVSEHHFEGLDQNTILQGLDPSPILKGCIRTPFLQDWIRAPFLQGLDRNPIFAGRGTFFDII